MSKNKFIRYLTVILRLGKFPLSLMVSFSALTGYFMTGKADGFTLLILLSGVFLLASGSSGLNQVQEYRFDLIMERTKNRPIPSGQISGAVALAISLIMLISGAFFLGSLGFLPLIFGLLSVALYNFLYTPLKRFTWLAIVPGSLVGALPPLIGWTSGGLSVIHPVILFVSLFVLLWQVPHFWLIFIRYSKDYKKAGFSVLPEYFNEKRIRNLVFCWALITSGFLCSFPFFGLKLKSPLIGLFIFLNVLFIILFHKFLFGKETSRSVRKAFILINSFAIAILVLLIFGNL